MKFFDAARERAEAAAAWMKADAERRRADKATRDEARDAKALTEASSVFVLPRSYIEGMRWVADVATVSVFFFLFLYSIDEAKDSVVTALLTRLGVWSGRVEFSIPLLVGFLLITAAIALYCKHWVVAFTQMKWRGRGEGWVRTIALVLGILTSALVVMGTFTMTQGGRIDAHRPEVEAQQSHQASIGEAQARLDGINADLRESLGPEDLARPSTQMQACRDGEQAWNVRIARTAPDDSQRGTIERAISSAVRCNGLRADRAEAIAALGALQGQVVGRAVAERDQSTAAAVDAARNVRGMLLALVVDLLAIFGALIVVALERVRQRQLAARAADLGLKPDLAAAPANAQDEPISPVPPTDPVETPAQDLNLPPLPDLREDPDFDERSQTVDENGRRQRRVAGFWRTDAVAPKSAKDSRRAPDVDDDRPLDSPDQGDSGQPTPADGDIDDIAQWAAQQAAARQAQRVEEPAK